MPIHTYRRTEPLRVILLLLTLTALSALPAWGYNIEVTGVEISQGTQNMANEMPLVLGRRMIVRVYARETTGETIQDVRAEVDVSLSYATEGGGAAGYGYNDVSTLATITPSGGSRLEYSESLNMVIDLAVPDNMDLTVPASLWLNVTVNPVELGDETEALDNTWQASRTMQVSAPLRLKLVPVHLHETPGDPQSPSIDYHLWDGADDLKLVLSVLRLHPLSLDRHVIDWTTVPVKPIGHAADHSGAEWTLNTWDGPDLSAVNERLAAAHMLEAHPLPTVFYGMVDHSASYWAGNAAHGHVWGKMTQGNSASSPWSYAGGDTVTHEIGHRRGLQHVKCSNEGNTDPDYPWPEIGASPCQLADIDPAGYYGLDVYYPVYGTPEPATISNDPFAAKPHRAFPFMGYKSPGWASPYEFCRLMNEGYEMECNLSWPMPDMGGGLVPPSVGTLLSAPEYLWVGGLLDIVEVNATLPPFYRMSEVSEDLLARTVERRMAEAGGGLPSGFSFVLRDATGRVLYEHPIYHGTEGEDMSTYLALSDLLPFPTGTAMIELTRDGVSVATRPVSPARPRVELFMPVGPRLEEGDVISWQGSDGDRGDELSYTVFFGYESAAAATKDTTVWEILELESRSNEFVVTAEILAGLGGPGQGRFKVLVSDGVNTGLVKSGLLEKPNATPRVWIVDAPAAPVASATPLTLSGIALDKEDGILGYGEIVWTSDLDGYLGVGLEIRPDLSAGTHEITLEATDSDGGQAQVSAVVMVEP